MPIRVFTIPIPVSRCADSGVHDGPIRAFTIARNPQNGERAPPGWHRLGWGDTSRTEYRGGVMTTRWRSLGFGLAGLALPGCFTSHVDPSNVTPAGTFSCVQVMENAASSPPLFCVQYSGATVAQAEGFQEQCPQPTDDAAVTTWRVVDAGCPTMGALAGCESPLNTGQIVTTQWYYEGGIALPATTFADGATGLRPCSGMWLAP
jgi:hypothetical protein